MRSSRIAGHVAALVLCTAAACSSSSSTSIPKGNLEIEGGPADATSDVIPGDAAEPVDGSSDSTEPTDSSQVGPSDAAPVDAAFACANPAGISDCRYCLNKPACLACAFSVVPSTVTQLKALMECTCAACYTACKGSLQGCSAPSPPNNCDTTVASDDNCVQCTGCAVRPAPIDASADGSCQNLQQICLMTPECNILLGDVRSACQVP